jgi:dihydrofolate reductase
MLISLIAAIDSNFGIGSENKLLWHLPDDFKWFKQHTIGKPLIMGRNTMLSLGKPLPKRLNIVISSSGKDIIDGFIHVKSIEEALNAVPENTEEVMVIGGGMIYSQMLQVANKLYITFVEHAFQNIDTFFPKWNEEEWREIYREKHKKDDAHLYPFDLTILERIA